MLAVTALAAALACDGHVTPAAGGALVAVFAVYVASVLLVIRRGWLQPPAEEDDEGEESGSVPSATRTVAILVLSLVVISGAAEAIVLGAAHIAHQVGLSEYAIGGVAHTL